MPAADPEIEEKPKAGGRGRPTPDDDRRGGGGGGSFLRELLVLLVTALVIAVGIKTFVAQAFYIPSGSMLPQLEVGDRIVVSKLSYKLHDPRRGDVVVFDSPYPRAKDTSGPVVRVLRGLAQAVGIAAPSTDEFVKRVVALPGETVEARGGRLFVNGRELVEPYLPRSTVIGDFGQVRVPAGEVFVMGDNRDNSQDSRYWGFLPAHFIKGRALMIYWSFESGEGGSPVSGLLGGTRWSRLFHQIH
jgi:signal peptidase I